MMQEQKSIFCVSHPRAVSTAFERVFMTRNDLTCVHEPFGDAFYYGPERMSSRYENDEEGRKATGFADTTYANVFERLERDKLEGKRLFIKDIIYYILPPDARPPQLAPSLINKKRGIGTEQNGNTSNGQTGNGVKTTKPFPFGTQAEPGNPTIIPKELLQQFHFTFLIRDPHNSIPSWYRCCVPPLDKVTGFYDYWRNEAGYEEVRRMFDYLVSIGSVGPAFASCDDKTKAGQVTENGTNGVNGTGNHDKAAEICVIDADDLLDDPEDMIRAYCKTVGLEFSPDMLRWEDPVNQEHARKAFEKWPGFHDDVLNSTALKPRDHKKAVKTEEQWDEEWLRKYGLKGANIIRQSVDENMETYRYLRQFTLNVKPTTNGV